MGGVGKPLVERLFGFADFTGNRKLREAVDLVDAFYRSKL